MIISNWQVIYLFPHGFPTINYCFYEYLTNAPVYTCPMTLHYTVQDQHMFSKIFRIVMICLKILPLIRTSWSLCLKLGRGGKKLILKYPLCKVWSLTLMSLSKGTLWNYINNFFKSSVILSETFSFFSEILPLFNV